MEISKENQQIIIDLINNTITCNCKDIELVEVTFAVHYKKLNVTAIIWKKDGISLDDCEYVHNFISSELDKYDNLFEEDYVLNVSSMGLNRQLKNSEDFRRSLNTEIEIIENNKQKHHGILKSYTDTDITINTGKDNAVFNFNQILKIQPFVKF